MALTEIRAEQLRLQLQVVVTRLTGIREQLEEAGEVEAAQGVHDAILETTRARVIIAPRPTGK